MLAALVDPVSFFGRYLTEQFGATRVALRRGRLGREDSTVSAPSAHDGGPLRGTPYTAGHQLRAFPFRKSGMDVHDGLAGAPSDLLH